MLCVPGLLPLRVNSPRAPCPWTTIPSKTVRLFLKAKTLIMRGVEETTAGVYAEESYIGRRKRLVTAELLSFLRFQVYPPRTHTLHPLPPKSSSLSSYFKNLSVPFFSLRVASQNRDSGESHSHPTTFEFGICLTITTICSLTLAKSASFTVSSQEGKKRKRAPPNENYRSFESLIFGLKLYRYLDNRAWTEDSNYCARSVSYFFIQCG